MADFTAGRLERIAASAYDLVANAFLAEPSAAGLQGQKLEPVCTEPFCGGLYWEQNASWTPEEAPPLPGMPHKGQGNHPPGDPDVVTPPSKTPAEAMTDMLASKPLDKLDLTGAKVFLPLDKPIATRVRVLPANKDEWQWWMAEDAKKVTLGVDNSGMVDIELGDRRREKILDHLTPFLRLDHDVEIEDRVLPAGYQLNTVKPYKKPLRVAPWIGSREQLRKDAFPLELTFGKPKKPPVESAAPNKRESMPGESKLYSEETQLLAPNPYDQPAGNKARPVGAPPLERLSMQEPITLPVKRLDVLLRRPREGLSDFLPPLLMAKEPHIDED